MCLGSVLCLFPVAKLDECILGDCVERSLHGLLLAFICGCVWRGVCEEYVVLMIMCSFYGECGWVHVKWGGF